MASYVRMRFILPIACALAIAGAGCKLEPSAATPNTNANANANQPVTSTAVSNQEPSNCSLKLASAPAINGLSLGMTRDEVLAAFPGSKDDHDLQPLLKRPPSALGVSEIIIQPAKYQPKEKKAEPKPGDVSQITFTLLDGRVDAFTVNYNGPQYAHVDNFVTSFLTDKNLPPLDQWQPYVGMDNQLKILNCAEFEVRVFASGKGGNLNYVLVKDLLAARKLKERRAKARAQATPTP